MNVYALHDYSPELKRQGCFLIDKNKSVEFNQKGYGIFFTPNNFKDGVRTQANLEKLNMWFVDIDTGNKIDIEKRVTEFLEPSLLVETRKGFHVYWSCRDDLVKNNQVDDYLKILERLIFFFDGDVNAGGVNRVLRVPNFYHCKDKKNNFLIRQVYKSEKSYSINEMIESLPEEKIENEEQKKESFMKTVPSDDFWEKVYDLDCFDYLPMLSGLQECNGDMFQVERFNGKGKIFVNDTMIHSCWIDADGKIGSHSNGGPSLGNWVKWYGHEWGLVAKCLKRAIPELREQHDVPSNFSW